VFSIAALQLATDLYHLIPFGLRGGSGGAPWGNVPWLRIVPLGGEAAAPSSSSAALATQAVLDADADADKRDGHEHVNAKEQPTSAVG
jgi:hypothetical protein